MSAEIRFAIIANPRTGTNHYIDLLNSHEEMTCHREVFHRDSVFLEDGTHDELVAERNNDPAGFLQRLTMQVSDREQARLRLRLCYRVRGKFLPDFSRNALALVGPDVGLKVISQFLKAIDQMGREICVLCHLSVPFL